MPGTVVVAFRVLHTVGPVGPIGSSNSSSVSVLLEQGQSVSSQTALRGKLGFILPSLQFWAVLGLPEVSQRWGKGWKEKKEISTRMLSVQETVKVQGRKGCLNRGLCLQIWRSPSAWLELSPW